MGVNEGENEDIRILHVGDGEIEAVILIENSRGRTKWGLAKGGSCGQASKQA
jgi:hypothetical protein